MTSLPSSMPPRDALTAPGAVAVAEPPVHALLAGIVDYAGLFPPAALDMPSAAQAYDRYRRGHHAWMLGTFVVPVDQVTELAEEADRAAAREAWPVALLAPSLEAGMDTLRDVRERWEGLLDPRALEIAPEEPKRIRALDARAVDVELFHEVPLDDLQEARLDAVADAGAAAKVRTGGVEARAFPHPVLLADFMSSCAERGLAFKATAGLHHPVGGRYPLTYRKRSAEHRMFGFLDLAMVAALLRLRRVDAQAAATLLAEASPAVDSAPDALLWAGLRLSVTELVETRARFFRSFGSCSFEEPVRELARLGLL